MSKLTKFKKEISEAIKKYAIEYLNSEECKKDIKKLDTLKMDSHKRSKILKAINAKIDKEYDKGLKLYRALQRKYKK